VSEILSVFEKLLGVSTLDKRYCVCNTRDNTRSCVKF